MRIIETMEAESFLRPSHIASGYGTVADILGETKEVKHLLANDSHALPALRSRYRELELTMPDHARLVYFIVFGLAHDREMSKEIIRYLRRCLALPISELTSPWMAFMHGAHALELITDGELIAPGTGASADQFKDFLSKVETWVNRHPRSTEE